MGYGRFQKKIFSSLRLEAERPDAPLVCPSGCSRRSWAVGFRSAESIRALLGNAKVLFAATVKIAMNT